MSREWQIFISYSSQQELRRREYGVPPLLLTSQCNPASSWKEVVEEVRDLIKSKERENG